MFASIIRIPNVQIYGKLQSVFVKNFDFGILNWLITPVPEPDQMTILGADH